MEKMNLCDTNLDMKDTFKPLLKMVVNQTRQDHAPIERTLTYKSDSTPKDQLVVCNYAELPPLTIKS